MIQHPFVAISFLFALLLPVEAFAFPELVRHGYSNCTACHVSPTGGGVLTAYGRSLSREILSTWGSENETRFVNSFTPPENVYLGGDFRSLGLFQETPQFVSGGMYVLQGDMEGAVKYGRFTFDATAGYNGQASFSPSAPPMVLRQHYIMYSIDDENSIRFGKFHYAYGINSADHMIPTRQGLQINDEGTEVYNLEYAWMGEVFNLYATAIFGRPDDPSLNRESGGALQAMISPWDSYKFGVNYLYGVSPLENRHVFGPSGIFGFTKKFFLLAELDLVGAQLAADPTGTRQWGFADSMRLDYEYFQGFHGFLSQGILRSDFSDPSTLTKTYGIGIQFFPRPHWDLDFEWQIHTSTAVQGYMDYAYTLLHYYL